jgi:hypothetical protein
LNEGTLSPGTGNALRESPVRSCRSILVRIA